MSERLKRFTLTVFTGRRFVLNPGRLFIAENVSGAVENKRVKSACIVKFSKVSEQ